MKVRSVRSKTDKWRARKLTVGLEIVQGGWRRGKGSMVVLVTASVSDQSKFCHNLLKLLSELSLIIV